VRPSTSTIIIVELGPALGGDVVSKVGQAESLLSNHLYLHDESLWYCSILRGYFIFSLRSNVQGNLCLLDVCSSPESQHPNLCPTTNISVNLFFNLSNMCMSYIKCFQILFCSQLVLPLVFKIMNVLIHLSPFSKCPPSIHCNDCN
jgi:hypothetical protein